MTQARIHLEVDEMLKGSQRGGNISRLCLNSFNCASMSTLLQTLFQSLISEDVCEKNDLEANHWKNMSFDEVIQLWKSSKGKRDDKVGINSNTPTTSSLVIFIFDFESVNKQTLLSLILILKEHLKTTPVSFIFFLSNQHNRSLHYYLPARATDCLAVEDIEPFYEPALIQSLLETLITDETIYFKLHPALLRPLSVHFTSHEFTFANFFALLKSILFDYFYSNPLSVVCQSASTGGLKAALAGNRSLLRLLQNSLPLVETIPPSGDDDDDDESGEAYIVQLETQLCDLHSRHARFTYNLQILVDLLRQTHCLQAGEAFQGNSLAGSHFLAFYCDTVAADLSFSKDLLSPLLRVPDTTWRLALRRVIARYKEGEREEDTPPLIALLAEYQAQLGELLRKEAEEEEQQLKRNKALGLEIDMVNVKAVKEKLRNVRSRTEWRQSMLPKATTTSPATTTDQKKDLRPFEQWKDHLLSAIDGLLRDTSPAPYRLLVEQLFYNNLEYVREHHFVCVRDRLAKSLSQTAKTAAGGSEGQQLRSFTNIYPNSFILYQLYRQAEPVVNLADWYEQFCEEKNRKSSISKSSSKKLKESAAPLSSDELTVHFSTTLSDFDYIGLMTSSRYKADYLNKLAWF